MIALWKRLFPAEAATPPLSDTAPVPPPAGLDPEILRLRTLLAETRIQLSQEATRGRNAAQRATNAERALVELTAARGAEPLVAENARLRAALLALDDYAEGCRRAHGGNTKASAIPTHPGAPA